MSRLNGRFLAICTTGMASFVLAGTAQAVDLRDWGRKITASERFVVLSQFNNEAVLDKETQLVWQRIYTLPVTWFEAYYVCTRAQTGGRGGWRLPTLSEIGSLMTPGTQAMPSVFSIPNNYYWTATEHPDADTVAMAIQSPAGQMVSLPSKSASYPFFCVRGAT